MTWLYCAAIASASNVLAVRLASSVICGDKPKQRTFNYRSIKSRNVNHILRRPPLKSCDRCIRRGSSTTYLTALSPIARARGARACQSTCHYSTPGSKPKHNPNPSGKGGEEARVPLDETGLVLKRTVKKSFCLQRAVFKAAFKPPPTDAVTFHHRLAHSTPRSGVRGEWSR